MRTGKRVTAFIMTGMLSLSAVFSSFGAEKPEGMDDGVWARLQDGKIEYDEIENLVLYFNPTYNQIIQQIDATTGYEYMKKSLEELKDEIKDIKDEAKKAQEEDDVMTYVSNTMLADTLENGALKSLKSGIGKINIAKNDTAKPIAKQLTAGIQQLMIGYNMALASRELTDTAAELADAAYQSTVSQKNLGMATAVDVENAEKSLTAARGQQQALNDRLESLRQNLSIMTGGSYDTVLEVGQIPAPDLERIGTMNPEQDIQRAISHNETVKQQRQTPEKSQAQFEYKEMALTETKEKLKTKLEALYQKVLESKTSYEAAQTALESAVITMNGNDLKYQMGMLGRLEYLQAKTGYLQQKMTYDMAVLNLKQAMENYNWAVYGVVELD